MAATHDCDFTGLELVEGQDVTVAAERVDPLAEEDDWCAVALRELMGEEAVAPGGKTAPTLADTAHSPQGLSRPAQAEAGQAAYVAPVIGPSAVTAEEAARRHALLETATTPAAQAVRQRDEEFRAQRTRTARALRGQEGVPQITRGFAACAAPVSESPSAATPGPQRRERSASDLVPAVERLIHVPDLDAPSPAVAAAVLPQASAAIPATLHDAAVAAAASAYSAFGSVGESTVAMPAVTGAPAARPVAPTAARLAPKRASAPAPDPATVSSSIAAAYAAAVYADVRIPEQVPAAVSAKPAPEPIADETAPLSAAYIDYLVRDEMEHRHDTIAQRNAATGAYRVISGAQGVVSVRDGIALRRYLA